MPECRVIQVHSENPDAAAVKTAGKVLEQSGIVIFPATCMYGIAANALNPGAVQKVFDIKQRPKNNPILVLIRSKKQLSELVSHIPAAAERLMETIWPGRLTIVFQAARTVSPQLTAGTGKIGIRIPEHPVARALTNSVDFPVTGTSANLSGDPSSMTVDQLPDVLKNSSDLILDAGELKGGSGSTIIDVTCRPAVILRKGRVSIDEIHNLLKIE